LRPVLGIRFRATAEQDQRDRLSMTGLSALSVASLARRA
jgi:hypothetical protein